MAGLIVPVIAGPFEDAFAADKRGDYATAARLYRPLAEQGNATAQHNLGFMYYAGRGVPQSDAEAVRWYRKAAEQGYAPSQSNLARHYYDGVGVSRDYNEALRWCRKAADQGDARSQTLLALMYLRGQGVKQNFALAYRWSSLALAQGFEPVKFLAEKVRYGASQVMTAAEIAEAKKQDEFYRRYGSFIKLNAKVMAIKQDQKRAEVFAKRLESAPKKWLPKSQAEMEYIHAIQFVDESTGFALDYNGNIHETHDGGLTWSQRRLPLELDWKERLFGRLTKPFFRSPEFEAMHFADKKFGMALNRLNPVVTRNGGNTWVGVPRPPTKYELRALWCTKKHVCFVGGIPKDVIYVFRDGEKKWVQQTSSAGCCLYSIQFVDEQKGWAVSHSGSIIKTEDGGLHWKRVFSDKRKKFWGLHFPTDKMGFVVGENRTIMRTFDGGNTWQDISGKIKTPIAIPKEALRFHAVKFADEKYGWIAGRYGIIFATSDGGDSWRLVAFYGVKPAQSSMTIYSLEVTPQKVWAAGNAGNIIVSIDNGHFWFPVHGVLLDGMELLGRIVDELAEKNENR